MGNVDIKNLFVLDYETVIINYGSARGSDEDRKDICVRQEITEDTPQYLITTYDSKGEVCEDPYLHSSSGIHHTIEDMVNDIDFQVAVFALGKTLVVDSIYLGSLV